MSSIHSLTARLTIFCVKRRKVTYGLKNKCQLVIISAYLLADVLSALDIFGLGFTSLASLLASGTEEEPRPRPLPLDPAPDISTPAATPQHIRQQQSHLQKSIAFCILVFKKAPKHK